MFFVTFEKNGRSRAGVYDRDRGEVIEIADPQGAPLSMLRLIEGGAALLQHVRASITPASARWLESGLNILAPIPVPPRNIICIGKNYADHVRELEAGGFDAEKPPAAAPDAPIFFTKATSAVTGPQQPIPAWLDQTDSTDYEGELAVVIGRGGRGIPRDRAMQHVFGYTIINDVTARRLQKRHQQWFLSKSIDGFCPMGPVIITRDAVPEVKELVIETRVNGDLRQRGSVSDLIFDIPQIIETLSHGMSLQPGDIIATGTPAGVGMGYSPPRFLRKGDKVAITIEPIGTLENPVV